MVDQRRRALVVDDERGIRELLSKILALANFDVCVAIDAQQGLLEFERQTPDLVITDLKMPGMDGLSFIREMKRRRPDIPTIICTGYSTENSAVEAVNLGVSSYITKPFRVPHVLAAVHNALKPPIPGEDPSDHPGLVTVDASPRDRVQSALAEIVGGFCHDFINVTMPATAVTRSKPNPGSELRSLRASMRYALRSVTELQHFVRVYYRRGVAESPLTSSSQVESLLLDDAAPLLLASRVRLVVNVSGPVETFALSRMLVRALAVPLIANAVESLRKNRSDAQKTVRVVMVFDSLHGEVTIVVSDNGPGWGDVREQIESRMKEEGSRFGVGGRGHGLRNVWRIVRKLGGEVSLQQAAGKRGARIVLSFPWAPAARGDDSAP